MNVVGLDLSLTDTGLVTAGDLGIGLHRVRSTGKADDDLLTRDGRLGHLASSIVAGALTTPPDLVAIEQPAYDAKGGHAHDRSGLWWLVVYTLLQGGVKVLEVAPSVVKTYATGKGNAGKDQVLSAMVRRHPDLALDNNNVADALVLAMIAARALGEPLDDPLPALNLRAMKTVKL